MTDKEKAVGFIRIMRNVTFTVKLLPFLGVVTYILCAVIFFIASPSFQGELDMMFYTSPMWVIVCLVLSKQMKLCKWHKLECVLPLLPRTLVAIDDWTGLTEFQAKGGISLCVFMFVLSLINAYFVFWRNAPTPPQQN